MEGCGFYCGWNWAQLRLEIGITVSRMVAYAPWNHYSMLTTQHLKWVYLCDQMFLSKKNYHRGIIYIFFNILNISKIFHLIPRTRLQRYGCHKIVFLDDLGLGMSLGLCRLVLGIGLASARDGGWEFKWKAHGLGSGGEKGLDIVRWSEWG